MNGTELQNLRESRNLSQRDLAKILDVTNSSVARWEAGQEIPSPMQKLLELFFHNTNPFPGQSVPGAEGGSSLRQLEFTLEEYEELRILAVRKGFQDVKAYICFVVKKHLAELRHGIPNVEEIQQSRLEKIYSDRLNEDAPAVRSK